MAHQQCAGCHMPRNQWQGNGGQGVGQNGQMYCCQGCANNSGCTCK
jgi:hypothetical protein